MKRLDLKHFSVFFVILLFILSFQNCSAIHSSTDSSASGDNVQIDKKSFQGDKIYPVDFDSSGKLLLLSPDKLNIQVDSSLPVRSLSVQQINVDQVPSSLMYVDLQKGILAIKIAGSSDLQWRGFDNQKFVEAEVLCPIPSTAMESLKRILQNAKLCKKVKALGSPICTMARFPDISEFLLSPEGTPLGLQEDDCSTSIATYFCQAEDNLAFHQAIATIYDSTFETPKNEPLGPSFWSGEDVSLKSTCKLQDYLNPL